MDWSTRSLITNDFSYGEILLRRYTRRNGTRSVAHDVVECQRNAATLPSFLLVFKFSKLVLAEKFGENVRRIAAIRLPPWATKNQEEIIEALAGLAFILVTKASKPCRVSYNPFSIAARSLFYGVPRPS